MHRWCISQPMNRLLFTLFTLLLAACSSDQERRAREIASSNVVVVVVDTLRADHLPLYGYAKDTAPFITALGKRSIVFDRAFSACSSTGPAMASVFTSMYPSQHGFITGFFATKRLINADPRVRISRIPSGIVTLGQRFKEAGFRTFGVSDNLNISAEQGFTKGFDRFVTYRYRGAPVVNHTVLEWKEELLDRSKGRYFLYVHYMDPHVPYHKREPWYEEGRNRRESLVNAYDSEIRYADEHIRLLFSELDLERDSIVVFLADHGEEFGEHGRRGHGKALYRESIHVPLFFYHQALQPRRVNEIVHTIDVLPTLASMLGWAPDQTWVGQTLEPFWQAGMPRPDYQERALFSQLLRRPEQVEDAKEAVVHQDHHLIVSTQKGQTPTEELFNLNDDFSESHNLAAEMPEVRRALGAKFAELHDTARQVAAEDVEIHLDREAIKSLKTLGYLE